jgi:DNA uptake protein ComE-like DNA-binding protein
MKEWLKGLFAFYRSESKGFLLLFFLIMLLIGIKMSYPHWVSRVHFAEIDFDSLRVVAKQQYENHLHQIVAFDTTFNPNTLDSSQWVKLGLSPRQAAITTDIIENRKGKMQAQDFKNLKYISSGFWELILPYLEFPEPVAAPSFKTEYAATDRDFKAAIPGDFKVDMNVCDKEDLLKLGLSEKQSDNILKFRKRGGKFKTSEDVSKLYTLGTEDIDRIMPHLIFPPKNQEAKTKDYEERKYGKYPRQIITLEINSADTAQWESLPFIGKFYTSKILQYRERVRGFYSVDQLYEVKALPPDIVDSIKPRLIVDSTHIRRFDANKAEYREMIVHPYFDDYHANGIITIRKKNGKILSLSQIDSIPFADEKRLAKMKKYLELK